MKELEGQEVNLEEKEPQVLNEDDDENVVLEKLDDECEGYLQNQILPVVPQKDGTLKLS